MSFARHSLGQNSLYLSGGFQVINAKGLNFSDALPFELDFGYQTSNKVLGYQVALNFAGNTFKESSLLTPVDRNSTYKNSRNVFVRNHYYGLSFGPTFNLPVSDDVRLKLLPSFNIGTLGTDADYDERRTELTSIGDNRFVDSKITITSSQTKTSKAFTHFFKFAIGLDLTSNFPIGLEIGYQNLNYGKTMNNLNPDKKYKQFNTKTDLIYGGFVIYLRKEED